MEIADAVHTDSGNYSCNLASIVGMREVAFAPVAVLGISMSSSVYPNVLVPGSEAHVVCRTALSHVPSVGVYINMEAMWGQDDIGTLKEHMRTSEAQLLESSSSSSSRIYGSNLTFAPLMGGDGGSYMCSVRCMFNSEGVWLVRNHTRSLVVDSKSSLLYVRTSFMCCVFT